MKVRFYAIHWTPALKNIFGKEGSIALIPDATEAALGFLCHFGRFSVVPPNGISILTKKIPDNRDLTAIIFENEYD